MDEMPKINLDVLKTRLDAHDYALIVGIVNTRTGALRASKPPVPKKIFVKTYAPRFAGDGHYDYADPIAARQGMTAYIWRNVAFSVSPNPQHQCMPVMDFCDLPGKYGAEQRALAKQLDAIVNVVVASVPKTQWHGVARWGQAFGMIGQPQYATDGSVIYR